MKIYVASSWRNQFHIEVVRMLQAVGHYVYNFRLPGEGLQGFSWEEIDEAWGNWGIDDFRKGLLHPRAVQGFQVDLEALRKADAVVLVLPCGRSSHLEAGFALGQRKELFIYAPEPFGPELMYSWATLITDDMASLIEGLRHAENRMGLPKIEAGQ